MKIKSNFILRQVAETWIAMPVGEESADIEGVLSLNNAGVLLWKCLERGCETEDLVRELRSEFDVDVKQATEDVEAFVEKLRNFNCFE